MKRKFKTLIMVISIVAMLFAFAISSSASQLANEDELFVSVNYFGGEDADDFYSFTTSPLMLTYDDFKIIIYSAPFSDSDNYYSYYLIGVEAFYNEITANVSSPNVEGEIYNYLSDTYENCDSALYYYGHVLYQEAHEYMNRVTQEDLEEKYSEGKLAGVEEYKSSEEYTNILNNKYSTGYTEGIESFKASTAYTDALDLQYSNGKTAGITEFKASVEFAKTLKAEYNEGYDAGVTDTQGVNAKNETTKLISILIGVLGFGILFMAVLSGVGAFKKKRSKRR